MALRHIQVKAEWDSEASVYVARSEDVPGLITEAETRELLKEKLRVMIPELLELNGMIEPGQLREYDLVIEYRSTETLHVDA